MECLLFLKTWNSCQIILLNCDRLLCADLVVKWFCGRTYLVCCVRELQKIDFCSLISQVVPASSYGYKLSKYTGRHNSLQTQTLNDLWSQVKTISCCEDNVISLVVTSKRRHNLFPWRIKQHAFLQCASVFQVTLDFDVRNSAAKMTLVQKQTFPVGSCGKRVGLCHTHSIYGDSTILVLGDSNLRALISGQCETAGEIGVLNKLLWI